MQYAKWLCQHIARTVKAWRAGLKGMTPLVGIIYITTRCEHVCQKCIVRAKTALEAMDADADWVVWMVGEFKRVGILYVDLVGGNPLLNPKALIAGLKECIKLRLYSSVTLSGPLIDSPEGREAIELATLVRFSIDGTRERHNQERCGGKSDFYQFIETGLTYARSIRKRNIQLLFTVDPREDGNLTAENLNSVLALSRKYGGVLISVNFLFNEDGYSLEQILRLLRFKFQAGVQLSLGKLHFILRGGNNISNPTCRATEDVVTITADGKMALPCFQCAMATYAIHSNLNMALADPYRQRLMAKSGYHLHEGTGSFGPFERMDGSGNCQGCTLWCYMIPSFANHWCDRMVVWLHVLSGLQKVRDLLLRLIGYLHPIWRYPKFKPIRD